MRSSRKLIRCFYGTLLASVISSNSLSGEVYANGASQLMPSGEEEVWPCQDSAFTLNTEGLLDRTHTVTSFGAFVKTAADSSPPNRAEGSIGIVDRRFVACFSQGLREILAQVLGDQSNEAAGNWIEIAIGIANAEFRRLGLNGWGFIEPPGTEKLSDRLSFLWLLKELRWTSPAMSTIGSCFDDFGSSTDAFRSIRIEPSMKIDPSIMGPGRVLVTFFPKCTEGNRRVVEILSKERGDDQIYSAFLGSHAELDLLAEARCVLTIEREPVVEPRLSSFTNFDTGSSGVSAPSLAAWPTLTGAGQVAGMIDLPFDLSHCAFSDAVPPGPTHRKVVLFDGPEVPWSVDRQLHGSAVAGLMAGDPPSSAPEARGVAPKAKLAFSPLSDLRLDAIRGSLERQYHIAGARVFSMSWGDSKCPLCNGQKACATTPLTQLFDSFAGLHENALVIAATSNEKTLRSPENGRQTMGVAATGAGANLDSFQLGGVGPNVMGQWKPEFRDRGCRLSAAIPNSGCRADSLPPALDPATGHAGTKECATSWAAPVLAGNALLVRQFLSEGGFALVPNDCKPTAALVRAVMVNAATLGEAEGPGPGRGWGRPETKSLDKIGLLVDVRNTDWLHALHEGGVVGPYSFKILPGGSVDVAISWTEPPYNRGTAIPVPADLDLRVVGFRRGHPVRMWYGNSSCGIPDRVNMIEKVRLVYDLDIDRYEVFVEAPQVLAQTYIWGFQGYSLAVIGDINFVATLGRPGRCETRKPLRPH